MISARVDVLLGIEPYHLWRDEDDHSKGDYKDGVPLQPSYEQQDEIFQAFIDRYPNLKCIARHVRYVHSGSENSLKAFMWYDGHTFESKLFTFNILDRVGGGDAFASGLIYAMIHDYRPMDMINFAVASSVLKHTIHGDANITDDAQGIRSLMNMCTAKPSEYRGVSENRFSDTACLEIWKRRIIYGKKSKREYAVR